MKNADQETVIVEVEIARRILGEYTEPGTREAEETIRRLVTILDDLDFITASNGSESVRSFGRWNKLRQPFRMQARPKMKAARASHRAAFDLAAGSSPVPPPSSGILTSNAKIVKTNN